MSGLQAELIVAPVDFSDESIEALDAALEIAENASDVHVVHVIHELNVADPGVVWSQINDHTRTEHALKELRKRLADDKYAQVEIQIEIGDPGHRVADYAARVGADLIVMSSHGRTGISHILLGSVAERVVRLSHCPVLVIRK